MARTLFKACDDGKDEDEESPLSVPASMGHDMVVKMLLDTGKLDADSRSSSGKTPLSRSALHGHNAVIRMLLDTGNVEADSKDRDG